MENAIEIKHLSVTLERHLATIKNLSVNIPRGKITGFIGPSGAGKTTLIRAIVGRQKISAGHIEVLGQPAGSASLRNRIAYMTQELSVYPDLTVSENLSYFAAMTGIARRHISSAIKSVLSKVDMTSQANKLVHNLSSGQKQRVSLAIALLGDPELLVLDEPTVGLDPVLREQLWRLFNELADRGKTVIISSHVMDEAGRCQDLLLIRDGELLAHSSPLRLCQDTSTESVEKAFIKIVERAR
jgi:ABC-2 type transport system ATP-binding protein